MTQNATHAGDEKLIRALAAGATVEQAAQEAGVSERTVYRRRKDADFRWAVIEAQGWTADTARGQLAGMGGKAVETLQRLLESDKPSEALAAAKAVLELGPRLRQYAELEERINSLEDINDEPTDGEESPEGEEELIQALAAGQVDVEPTDPRQADPRFQRDVSRARGWLLGSAAGRLAGLDSKAAGILERLLESEQPSVARRAAKAVLLLGPRLRESTELDARVSLLEELDRKSDGKPRKIVHIDEGWYGDASN